MATQLLYRNECASKVCSKCGEAKPRTEFNKFRSKERAYCKACHVRMTQDWVSKNKRRRKEYSAEWYQKNKERAAAWRKKPRAEWPEWRKAKQKLNDRKRHLGRKYGITPEQWDAMFAAQSGVCAICKVPDRTGKHGKLVVDHCHSTGRVRGLLCTPCNISIGILGETPEQWEVVHRYLRGD